MILSYGSMCHGEFDEVTTTSSHRSGAIKSETGCISYIEFLARKMQHDGSCIPRRFRLHLDQVLLLLQGVYPMYCARTPHGRNVQEG